MWCPLISNIMKYLKRAIKYINDIKGAVKYLILDFYLYFTKLDHVILKVSLYS